MQTDIYKDCDSLLTITDKMNYLEGQNNWNKLVIDGVAETSDESWTQTEEKVQKILVEQLQLQKVEVERAHCLGKFSGRPRAITVRLLRSKDRNNTMESKIT